jgi:L-seryl-tRNA(Ser) seleniumtransferase
MEKNEINRVLREIPQVEKLLQDEEIEGFIPVIGKVSAADCVREGVNSYREALIAGAEADSQKLKDEVIKKLKIKSSERLQRVINGTGIIIHTNLGRAPLGEGIFEILKKNISGYCNLEYYIPAKKRGKRGGFAEELICQMTKSEDALIVNNNASSVFLILNELAKGGETIVSRGELIQIGGGFRIPDIMNQSGTTLVEVGTTNITTLDDFKNAITDNTKMIFSAHTSNFRLEGFTEAPSLKELSALKNDRIVFVRDMGSGNLVNDWMPGNFEQTVYHETSQGADLVCFSGDKLLGGCQAGIIVGKKEIIAKLRKNPLMRMLRVDKITYTILQETLLLYVNGRYTETGLWSSITQGADAVSQKASRLIRMCGADAKSFMKKVKTRCAYGGGSMPGEELDSFGIEIALPGMSPDEVYDHFVSCTPPVVGTVRDGRYVIDMFTVHERDMKDLAEAVKGIL